MPKDRISIVQIAKVYIALGKLYNNNRQFWPDDNNTMDQCLRSLEDAAAQLKIESPEDCLAILTIVKAGCCGPHPGEGPLDVMERRAIETGEQIINRYVNSSS